MTQVREALEASWCTETAYLKVLKKGNPALGQCHPTSRVFQFFFPESEIVEGEVWTGEKIEKHFWNILKVNKAALHIDFTWKQFPHGSSIRSYKIRNCEKLNDGVETLERVDLLYKKVNDFLAKNDF